MPVFLFLFLSTVSCPNTPTLDEHYASFLTFTEESKDVLKTADQEKEKYYDTFGNLLLVE